jgi:hypothetical protein
MDQHHGNPYEKPPYSAAPQHLGSGHGDPRMAFNNQVSHFAEPYLPVASYGNRAQVRADLTFHQLCRPPLHSPDVYYCPSVMHPPQHFMQAVPPSLAMPMKNGKRLIVIDGSNVAMRCAVLS